MFYVHFIANLILFVTGIYVYVCMYVCMCVCTYMYIHMYVCMYVCMYVRMYACTYIYRVSQEEGTKLREGVP